MQVNSKNREIDIIFFKMDISLFVKILTTNIIKHGNNETNNNKFTTP